MLLYFSNFKFNYHHFMEIKQNLREYYTEKNESKNNIQMQKNIRTEVRLLSSLRDLKLNNTPQIILTQERRRQPKRLCPIKARSEDEKIYENFKIQDKKKQESDVQFISKSLSSHFTFSSLLTNRAMREQLIAQFRLCKVEQKEYLMKQNDNASSFFILKDGQLVVQINGENKNAIKSGQGFGQLALLYSTPRSASILAKKTSYLWFIDRTTFRNCVSSIIEKSVLQNKKFISMNKFFTYLTDKQKQKLASIAMSQKFEKGAKICKQGQKASAMYIVKSGKLKRSVQGLSIGYFVSGDSLEQYATLNKNCTRKQTITAEQTTEVLAFGTEQIEKVLGKSLPIIILRNNAKRVLMDNTYFKLLSKQFIQKVIDSFKIKNIEAGQYAFKEGEYLKNKIVFIIQGDYDLTKNQDYDALYGSLCIGDPKKRMAHYCFSCIFKSEGKIAETSLEEIQKQIGFSIDDAIQKSVSMIKMIQSNKNNLQDLKKLAKTFELKDFSVLKKLGEGQFGQVYLVNCNKNNRLYALKCISKAQTLKYKLQRHLINEKKVLEEHNSAFTLEFIRSFNDENYVYFLTEFLDGLELFDALRVIGLVPIPLAKFYSACILHSLESLHNQSIIYRDLKPQNIMVQADGYIKIIDMGTCKSLKSSNTNKTFTIIGTPNYMAPQIISGKGYSFSADLWSLGILMFEFLGGYLPFGEHCDDPYEIYQQILKTHLKFPKYMKDVSANNFIVRMLSKNSESRLGESYSELKNHDFFKQIEWNQLLQRKITPSFKPPKEYLIKLDPLLKNMKPLQYYLKHPPLPGPKRTDLKPNWDNCF